MNYFQVFEVAVAATRCCELVVFAPYGTVVAAAVDADVDDSALHALITGVLQVSE